MKQAGWKIESDSIECYLTRQGGQMAPVVFFRDTARPIAPYYISPWQNEDHAIDEPVLRPLRGDFFCLPFGGNPPWRGEAHPAHGETASSRWKKVQHLKGDGFQALELSMEPKIRPGNVTKQITLRDGENAIYIQHTLEGFSGRMPLGHHAILAPPEKGILHISTSPIIFGQTAPRSHELTDGKEYYALAPNRRFQTLEKVSTIWKNPAVADCSVFPAREGFVDILSLFNKPSAQPAWTCAAAPESGWLWFALKDSATLPSTVMWMENHGRHGAPWNGRNCCIGLEEVCAFHAEGLKASVRSNELSAQGIATSHRLSKKKPLVINVIQGAVRIPKTFDRVKRLRFTAGTIDFISFSGKTVSALVHHSFIHTGDF